MGILFIRLIGIFLMLLSVYYLGQNITFITQSSPFWWSGIAANFSVFCLTGGVIGFFFLPKDAKFIGWVLIILGIVFVFLSSRAILQPTSLWQFFVSIVCFVAGFKLFTIRRFRF